MSHGLNIRLGYKVTEEDVREICSRFTDVDLEMDYSDYDPDEVDELEAALDGYLEKIFGDEYCCTRLRCHSYEAGGNWIVGYKVCNLGGFDEIGEEVGWIMRSGEKVKELKKMHRKLKLKGYEVDVEPKYYSLTDSCYSCT